jgi:hypothetical protein
MDIACGESLFGDFSVTLGFDNDPALDVSEKPLTLLHWLCKNCWNGGSGHDEMVAHARTHFPAQVASRAGE